MNNKPVVVRTYSAGVWFGEMVDRKEREVQLVNARRVWRWKGANTCSELALRGPDVTEHTRIAEPVTVTLTEAIEIIDATPEAAEKFRAGKWNL